MKHVWTVAVLFVVFFAGVVASPHAVLADTDVPEPGKVGVGHKHLMDPDLKGIQSRTLFPGEAQPWEGVNGPGPVVNREVLGYLPYWQMDKEILHWEYLTLLAWFSVNMNSLGDAIDLNGWGSASTEALVEEAHAHGVRVLVTVTNFSKAEIGTLLQSPTARQNAIDTCLELIATHNADGVNIDFEFVPASAKAEFVTFMADLKAAVTQAQPNGQDGHVSLAGPAVDWGGAYDYDQLLEVSDGIMVMAYGYHWSGGDPGPISPLQGGGKWAENKSSIAWTIDDYLTWGGEENRHRIFIGLPWYGREWRVANSGVPGVSLGDSNALTFSKAKKEAQAQGKQYDTDSMTAFYHITRDEDLWQVWYDDGPSFEAKIAYVVAKDLGGIGIWALGYDGGHEDLWTAIGNTLVQDTPVPPVEGDVAGGDEAEMGGAEAEMGDEDAGTHGAELQGESDAGGGVEVVGIDGYRLPRTSRPGQTTSMTTLESGGCSANRPTPPTSGGFIWGMTMLMLAFFGRRLRPV